MRPASRLLVLLGTLAVLAPGCADDAGSDGDSTGADSQGDGDGDGDGDGGTCVDPNTHTGEGTYYDADGSGNCSFPATPDDLMVGAMNHTDYGGSAACGRCVHVDGPEGSVEVRIVDRCPECAPGDIDLSPQAFEQIAPLSAGRVDISWSYIPCPVDGAMDFHFKDGSNQWWTAVQPRNHRHGVDTLEVELEVDWVDVPRLDYNFFVLDSGMGPGPYHFRVTDVWGHAIEDNDIPLLDDATAPGAQQFPGCGD